MTIAGLMDDSSKTKIAQNFVDAIEAKDLYTRGHSHHVNVVADAILNCLPESYPDKPDREMLSVAAILHDIGKIMTPGNVLNKDGQLDDEEWQIMRRHPEDGKNILAGTEFDCLGDWVLYHHERMDGRGYYGLKGTEIPLAARIIAVADTFSALRTYRIYRPAKSIAETISIMRECAGPQLDPEITGYFLAIGTDTLETLECNCEICRLRRQTMRSAVLQ